MKTLKVNCYGEELEVWFYTDVYSNNDTLYIGAMCKDKNNDIDFYGNVSTNVMFGNRETDEEFYADRNNSNELIKIMLEEKLIEDMHESVSSGFCKYPKMKITEKFKEYLEEVTED